MSKNKVIPWSQMTPAERLADIPVHRKFLKSWMWKRLRGYRLALDGYQCQRCGSRHNLTVHHLTNEHREEETMVGLVTLCRSCHSSVHFTPFSKRLAPRELILSEQYWEVAALPAKTQYNHAISEFYIRGLLGPF